MSNVIKKYKRIKKDREVIIEDKQKELLEIEKARISRWYNAEGDELEKLMEEYATDDKLSEYLVDGAVLMCTGATLADSYGVRLNINQGVDSAEMRLRTVLNVTENPVSVNGLIYATVRDSIQNKNVLPFRCNCSLMTGRYVKVERIEADENCSQEGTCQYFMNLSAEWENMPLEEKQYLMMSDVNPTNLKGGIACLLDASCVEGITMTSVLFCKRGGLIYPETSGQNEMKKAMGILRTYLKEGKYDEDELELALQLLAFNSNIGLFEYSSKTGLDYNRYDNYILGWCVYYSEEIGINIEPSYIKAMMYQETRMGYYNSNVPTNNPQRDVMQALDIKNTNIYNYIGIEITNFKAETSNNGFQTCRWIWDVNGKYGVPGSPAAKRQDRCGGIVRSLFNSEKDGSGQSYTEGSSEMYYFMIEDVTPIMSIAIAMDFFCELLNEHGGDYKEALKAYNSKESYAIDVINRALTHNFVGD